MAKWWFMCFFFKQKTAYELRISDWSSDVCSSDLSRRRQSDRTDAGGPSLLGKFKEARLNPAKLRSIAPVVFGSERCPLPAVGQRKQKRSEERRVGKECVSTCRYRG